MLPATHNAELLSFIGCLVGLALWVNLFKAVAPKYRWELFSVDFALGAVILALVASYTLGTMGTDLGVGDRILVAGRTSQALALIAGAVFGLGSMLLLASISLVGAAVAFPFAAGVALIVSSAFHFHPGNSFYLVGGILITLVVLVLETRGARLREAASHTSSGAAAATQVPAEPPVESAGTHRSASATVAAKGTTARKKVRPARKTQKHQRAVRGIVAALFSGIPLALFIPVLQNCLAGDLGLQAYAGMLLFGIGMFLSTIVYDLYFLNVPVEGSSLTFAAYFRASAMQHVSGLFAGAILMAGLLAGSVAMLSPIVANIPAVRHILYPLLCVPLASLFGIAFWRELKGPGKVSYSVPAGVSLFVGALALFSYGFSQ
jgi:glucose uptake protein